MYRVLLCRYCDIPVIIFTGPGSGAEELLRHSFEAMRVRGGVTWPAVNRH